MEGERDGFQEEFVAKGSTSGINHGAFFRNIILGSAVLNYRQVAVHFWWVAVGCGLVGSSWRG